MDKTEAKRWTELAETSALQPGSMLGLEIEDKTINLYRLDDGSFHATDNICTHAFALLSEGWLEGDAVECPLHGGCFDVRTGKGLCAPITQDLKTYPVEVRGEMVLAALDD